MITPERKRILIEWLRQGDVMRFYNSKEWKAVRKKARARDNFECQICKSKGKYHRVENVHHLKEVRTHPHLALTLSNLQSLCIRCHNEVHERLEDKEKEKKFMNEERW